MSTHDYTRALVSGLWNTDLKLLNSEVVADLPGEVFTLRADGTDFTFDFVNLIEGVDLTTLNTAVTDHQAAGQSLSQEKVRRYEEIDVHTAELIFEGFEYPVASGNIFSLSERAQLNLAATKTERDNAALVYVVIWPGLDDTHQLTIDDDAEFDLFYTEAYDARKGHLDTGNVLKKSVLDAADRAAVDAVVDGR